MKIALICIVSIIVIPAIIYGTACIVDAKGNVKNDFMA